VRGWTVLLAVLAAGAGGCGDDDDGAHAARTAEPPARISFPSGASSLESLVGELQAALRDGKGEHVAALAGSLELPDAAAWFEQHFAPEVAARLTAEYEPLRGRMGELGDQVRALAADGRTLIAAERYDDPGNLDATGYQALALRAMTHDAPLYSVRLRKDGEGEGFHIWSFVHDGDSFRFAGKMRTVKGPLPSPAPDPDPLELRQRAVAR
jgi:hypothetical protein